MSKSKRNPEKEAFWRSVREEHQRSGLTAREFCRNKGLSEASFHSWKRVLAGRDGESKVPPVNRSTVRARRSGQDKRLVPRSRMKRASSSPSSFVPVEIIASPITSMQELTIRTPAGFTIDFPATVDIGRLGQVLEVLAKQSPSLVQDAS